MLPRQGQDVVSGLLRSAGFTSVDVVFEDMAVGGNNRVQTVLCGNQRLAVKWYVQGSDDGRDRLFSEWAFLHYARGIGLRCVPQPLARDRQRGAALYEFIEGRPWDGTSPGEDAVAEAASFLRSLNAPETRRLNSDLLDALPPASEACFSIGAHLKMLDGRIGQLVDSADRGDEVDLAAVRLVDLLSRHWRDIRRDIADRVTAAGDSLESELAPEKRCISPSDFGFHNVLVRPDGRLCFIDFEYAGWDDPAKMIGDFFLQPAVPVDRAYRDRFVGEVMGLFPDSEGLVYRARLLWPVFALKWGCIMLNVFLPAWRQSRLADRKPSEVRAIKEEQLRKAAATLAAVRASVERISG